MTVWLHPGVYSIHWHLPVLVYCYPCDPFGLGRIASPLPEHLRGRRRQEHSNSRWQSESGVDAKH
jgi:hypothetical protein